MSEVCEGFRMAPIGQLHESKLNPRRHYDEKKIDELAESIRSVGIVEPLLVRPDGDGADGLEIVAGSRRYRAAKRAELSEIPVLVRELDDTTALELMIVENNQREDVNALEEAEGYNRLLARGYNLERLAERIGRSTKYIYDRMKLLRLVDEAKKLLLADKIAPGHAILLARLKPEEQMRVIDRSNFDVWNREALLFAPDEEPDEEPVKIVSVRELESWIDQHVRFDKKAPDPMLFPETAASIQDAEEMRLKVIQISHNYQTPRDAKEGNDERIYHCTSWKLADGSGKEAKTCEKSVTGVIVVGPERGKAYKVCVHKECPVHWAKEKRERERRKKEAGKGPGEPDSYQKEQERLRTEQEARREKLQEWKNACPEIFKACAEKLKGAKVETLGEIILRSLMRGPLKKAMKFRPKPRSAEDLVFIAALTHLGWEMDHWEAWRSFPARVKHLGVDVAAILKAREKSEEKDTGLQTSANGAGKGVKAMADSKKTKKTKKAKGKGKPAPEGEAPAPEGA